MSSSTFLWRKITDLKQQIDALRPLNPELQKTLQERLRIEWTYNSNALEGNTLTFGETAFFLRKGLTSEGKPLKDYLEAKNHAEAIDGLHEVVRNQRLITEGLIKELHGVLMKGIEFTYAKGAHGLIKKPFHAGRYKTHPNHVLTLSGKIHYYTDQLHVKDEMEKLIQWYNDSGSLHPVDRASIFHYRFVAIHPFDDGNGRLARLLMNLILMKEGYPPCIIKNTSRREYLKALESVDTGKIRAPFIGFVAKELTETLETILAILLQKEEPFPAVNPRLNQSQREALILETIGASPLSISQIHEQHPHLKRPTLKNDLKRLVLQATIKQKGNGKGRVYYR